MMRRSKLAVVVLATLVGGCQTYTEGLQQSVARANETAALATLKTIGLAEQTYSLTNSGEYGTLKQLSDGGFIDVRYGGEKPVKDYVVTCEITPKAPGTSAGSFSCNADPDQGKETAGRHLYIDSTSDGIHVNDTKSATTADKLMQ